MRWQWVSAGAAVVAIGIGVFVSADTPDANSSLSWPKSGHESPAAAVAGYYDSSLSGDPKGMVSYVEPIARESFAKFVGTKRLPRTRAYGERIGSVHLDGDSASVVVLGRFCGLSGCVVNENPTTTNPSFRIPSVKLKHRWFIDVVLYEKETSQISADGQSYVDLSNGIGIVKEAIRASGVRSLHGLTPKILNEIYPGAKWVGGSKRSTQPDVLSAAVSGDRLTVASMTTGNRCWFSIYEFSLSQRPSGAYAVASGIYWNAAVAKQCKAAMPPKEQWSANYLTVRDRLPGGG